MVVCLLIASREVAVSSFRGSDFVVFFSGPFVLDGGMDETTEEDHNEHSVYSQNDHSLGEIVGHDVDPDVGGCLERASA